MIKLTLYKIGSIVACVGQAVALENHAYNCLIPIDFRPKKTEYIAFQELQVSGISTATLNIRSDGTINTNYPYSNKLVNGIAFWETA